VKAVCSFCAKEHLGLGHIINMTKEEQEVKVKQAVYCKCGYYHVNTQSCEGMKNGKNYKIVLNENRINWAQEHVNRMANSPQKQHAPHKNKTSDKCNRCGDWISLKYCNNCGLQSCDSKICWAEKGRSGVGHNCAGCGGTEFN